MADYHTTYKGPEGETTEWEDLQRKHGNLPPKEPAWKPEAWAPEAEARRGAARVKGKDADELSDLEDEEEFADDRFLEDYR
jgi:CelD/BcsL family acetyltransferase involved in cellulose biosynthesis